MTFRFSKLLRTICVALGITSIFLMRLVVPLVTGAHLTLYHWSGSPSELFLPAILNFCAFWLLATMVLLALPHSGRVRGAIWCGMIVFTPWITLKNCAYLLDSKISHWVNVLLLGMTLLAFLFPLVMWRPTFEGRVERIVKFASTVLVFAGMMGAVVLCEVAWFGWKARSLDTELPLHRTKDGELAPAGRPRIIWIIFDELSYQQVYERRFPGLQLPAFDALATQSTLFTHTIPAGILTERVLPSLITGEPVHDISSSSDGRHVSLRPTASATWKHFDEHDTVFQDALNLGYRTAVAGWYNPYCRILPDVLDRCFWIFGAPAQNAMVPAMSLGSNLMMPLRRAATDGFIYRLASVFFHFSNYSELDAQQHISDYVTLERAADAVLDDPSYEFSLIHLPVPHPSGIYDRATGRFVTKHSNYLDNLALADRLLGHIRSKLEGSGQWDGSTIVLMGDHSWRTKLFWRDTAEWTDEEQRASHGGEFDDRPAYVVKLAGQQVGARFDGPFAAVNTRRLLDGLLSQQIRSAEELSAWAKRVGN